MGVFEWGGGFTMKSYEKLIRNVISSRSTSWGRRGDGIDINVRGGEIEKVRVWIAKLNICNSVLSYF